MSVETARKTINDAHHSGISNGEMLKAGYDQKSLYRMGLNDILIVCIGGLKGFLMP